MPDVKPGDRVLFFTEGAVRIELDGERPFGPAMPRLPDAAD